MAQVPKWAGFAPRYPPFVESLVDKPVENFGRTGT